MINYIECQGMPYEFPSNDPPGDWWDYLTEEEEEALSSPQESPETIGTSVDTQA